MRLRRGHGITTATGISAGLMFIDLQWSSTLHYRLAQPDFYVYYLAARLGRALGWAAIYDPAVFLPPVTAAIGKPLPYLNPPELAWLVTPLSFLPYAVAAWIWTGVLAAAFVIIWYLAAPGRGLSRAFHGIGAAALLPVFVGILFGQVSLVVVAVIAVSWWLLSRERPWLAGLALSALILKPQIAFLVPLALLLAGYGRVFLAWIVGSLPLAVVTLLTTGEGKRDAGRAPNRANVNGHLERVARKCRKPDLLLLAFAGHGMQFGDEAFFCPSDADHLERPGRGLRPFHHDERRGFSGDEAVRRLRADAPLGSERREQPRVAHRVYAPHEHCLFGGVRHQVDGLRQRGQHTRAPSTDQAAPVDAERSVQLSG